MTLQESKIIKIISKKLVRKAIYMLRNLMQKDESKKEKDGDIDNDTKEVWINKVTETDNDELVVDATNNAPPPQDAITTTTAAADEECGVNNNLVAKDGNNDDEAEDSKGRGGGAIHRSKTAMTMTTNRR